MGIMKNGRQLLRALRAIRAINPPGIPFSFVDMLSSSNPSVSRYPEYDYDDIALMYAMNGLLLTGELIRSNGAYMRQETITRVKPYVERVKTLDAREVIA